MRKINIDYLANHKNYKVAQYSDGYHFNSDTCLLGEYVKVNEFDNVLDVGTNTAALLVYCFYKGCNNLTGIDINKKALKLAKKTCKLNNFKAKLIHHDFTTYISKNKYSIIVCNPPYFTNNDSKKKNIFFCKHNVKMSYDLMFKSMNNNLAKCGKIYMVYRSDLFNSLNKYIEKNNLKVTDSKIVNKTILFTIERIV